MNTISRTLQAPGLLPLLHPIRQLIPIVGRPGKMLCQSLARHFNRLHDGGGKILALEVSTGRLDELLPEFVATTLVNPLVTDDRKFL